MQSFDILLATRMSSVPKPSPDAKKEPEGVLYSPAAKTAIQVSMPVGAQLGWDSYVRLLYEQANKALQQQANELLARGNITQEEARALVETQRNGLVLEFRKRLSPWGRLYSEISKPSGTLPTLQKLVAEKGSIEAVVKSVGKTRAVVNRIAVVSRVAGPVSVIVSITFSAIAIRDAPAGQKGRVAATELGGTAGGLGLGTGGSWAGCLTFAEFLSPSLAIPGWGELTEGGACLVGGIAGGLGFGYVGDKAGRAAGAAVYDFVTTISYQ